MDQETTQTANVLKHSRELANICQFFSRLWLREIDLPLLTELTADPLAGHYKELGGSVPNEINQNVVDELSVDYCQLLIGPKDFTSPVQSVWAESQFSGKAFADVQQFYALIADYRPPSELLDHFGVELDFLSRLFLASQDDSIDDGERMETISLINLFFEHHVRWSSPMLKSVEAKAKTEFYRCFAKSTRTVLAMIESEL